MRNTTAVLLALTALVVAPPADATNRSCNLALVGQLVCSDSTHYVLAYDAPPAAFADLRDAILDEYQYQDDVVCATTRQYEPLINGQPSAILAAAGVSSADCVTVGSVVPNPQSTADYADAVIEYELRNRVIQWKHNAAQDAAADPTTIPTPDIGDSP